jgi:acyl carrier protein
MPARYGLEEAAEAVSSSASDRAQAEETGGASLPELLSQAPDARRRSILSEHVLSLALRVLGFPPGRRIDPQQPLNELGLDSLMSVEFRNLLAAEVKQNLPSTLLFNYPTVDDVVGYVGGLLLGEQRAKPAAEAPRRSPRDPLELIEDLSDEDVDKLLTSKLGVAHG